MSGTTHDAAAEGTDDNATVQMALLRGDTSPQALVTRTPRKGPLISLTPLERRLVISGARVGVTIADGLFLSSTVANPLLTVSFIAYESFRAVNDYWRGELNTLGYRTSATDVALRIGKEVGTAAIGIAIGHGVGTLIGLSAIPVAGQVVTATVLSVTMGLCVGTLLTRYADRIFIRLQLQAQYGYSRNEQKSRTRFEHLLEAQHDLSSFETCRIVQHYRDYRVACGWESQIDVDDYRASADITMMPVSFQHFAIVQLQRKWGFLNEYVECKKVFKALMLLHHPDKGGDGELAAQLNHDYEIYAFCQGWHEDCRGIFQREGAAGPQNTSVGSKRRKRSTIVGFLRSLFRPASNSAMEAEDLRQYGLLALEAGTPPELHRLDEVDWEAMDKEEVGGCEKPMFGTSAFVKQRGVSRVLASIHRCYQLASEAITFAGLVRLYKETKEWSELERDIYLFNRLQTFVNVVDDIPLVVGERHNACKEYSCRGLKWCTKAEAVLRREERREAIVSRCFPPYISSKLMEALELWKTAQNLAKSFFKQGSTGGCGSSNSNSSNTSDNNNETGGELRAYEGTGQTLDTLLNIQKALQDIVEDSTQSWKHTNTSDEEALNPSFMEKVKALGLTASCALAGAHARGVEDKLRKTCEEFFRGRRRKLETTTLLLNEMYDLQSSLTTATVGERETLQGRYDDFMKQLFLVHYLFGELDAATVELYDIYTMHLPEKAGVLKTLPSSCAQAVHEALHLPRYVKYERERTLINYMNIEVEPRNAMDPSRSPADGEVRLECECEVSEVQFALLRAQYVDSVNGTVTPCWLKRYVFPRVEGVEAQMRIEFLFKTIMQHELCVPELCATHRVTCVTDVFADDSMRQIYFHIPRGGTQLRFGSTHDVRKRIMRLGVRWLHDALQCVIDLHSCQLLHGAICLSNFTYDEFGNTTLGFFSNALRDRARDAVSPLDDAIDFGACLHAEVLPYLLSASTAATAAARQSILASGREEQVATGGKYSDEEVADVYREVADRLIGKAEPRWALLDARTFVRRFLEANYNSDERNYLFTKDVAYPASWATLKPIVPVSLVLDDRVSPHLPPNARAFLNRNQHLWEVYWKCRREMVKRRGGGFFSMPAALKGHRPFLPCGDDCEVNERFAWRACADEEEAWRLCLEGFVGRKCRLRLAPPQAGVGGGGAEPRAPTVSWGVIFRASLGTVEEADGRKHPERSRQKCTPPTPGHLGMGARDLGRSAEKSSVFRRAAKDPGDVRGWEIVVPAPGARCYPEYVVCGVWVVGGREKGQGK
ncbi:transferase [Trypanosoma rangeli]|uniref:Transferase n=1 Tax=Trypanosoma rangeli TaxID=5698 RepID=A0A3R7N1F5_TRYRA|nr:transferase [Trypanosoma rangeli]RNF11265.1 transferase [Trypanosoma rangeli]|eukprot:RNF11265.1 transferase [Trypanosoma rangeli]